MAYDQRIPIFPLPGLVSFPGHTHHFHIFEPRYRKMVLDCIEQQRELGLALALRGSGRRNVHSINSHLPEQARNQQVYQPASVAGVGPVNILERFSDGRMVIEVTTKYRAKIISFEHAVPYYLAVCHMKTDQYMDNRIQLKQRRHLLVLSEKILREEFHVFSSYLHKEYKGYYSLAQLVHNVLKWFRVDPTVSQRMLETDLVEERAQILLRKMQQYQSERSASLNEGSAFASSSQLGSKGRQKAAPSKSMSAQGKVIFVDFTEHRHTGSIV